MTLILLVLACRGKDDPVDTAQDSDSAGHTGETDETGRPTTRVSQTASPSERRCRTTR